MSLVILFGYGIQIFCMVFICAKYHAHYVFQAKISFEKGIQLPIKIKILPVVILA